MTDEHSLLTGFQLEVAQLFFGLPAARDFLLAGGAALLAQRLTTRPTQDLDFFTGPGAGDVARARDELVAAATERGWPTEQVQDSDTFGKRVLLERAGELDAGFDQSVFAT